MFYCLCVSIIFMVIILSKLGKSDERLILTNQQLRSMYDEDKNNYIKEMVNQQYNSIFDSIIRLAIERKTVGYFIIMCIEKPIHTKGYKNCCGQYRISW